MINFNVLNQAFNQFTTRELPFLFKLREQMMEQKPYCGLKILHNTPIALITVCKIETLLLGGADVIVTNTKGHPADPEAINILKKANVKFNLSPEFNETYDIYLDCCADLINAPKPRLGIVELTQTGSLKYKNANSACPIVSLDDSKIKYLENFLGTGEGFIRAFIALTHEEIKNKKFMIFGFGKVGKGVVKALKPYTNDIVIVDQNKNSLLQAKNSNLLAIESEDKNQIYQQLQNTFCVVTATGVKNLISDYYNKAEFLNKYLVQLSVEDEFGYNFATDEILFNKQPINFALKEPTRVKYLDPVFYAHNLMVEYLLAKKIPLGCHSIPDELDNKILQQWFNYHQENIDDILSLSRDAYATS